MIESSDEHTQRTATVLPGRSAFLLDRMRRVSSVGSILICAMFVAGSVTSARADSLDTAQAAKSVANWPSEAELARNWASFRGSASGVVAGTAPSDWDGPSERNILWKTPIDLPGNNSPIVWNDSIFLSGATPERQEVFCFDT